MEDDPATVSVALLLAVLFALAYLLLSLFLSTLQALGQVSIHRLLTRDSRLMGVFGRRLEETPALLSVSLQIAHRVCYAAALLLLLTDLWSRGLSPGRIVVIGVAAFGALAVLEQVGAKPLAMINPKRFFPVIVPALIGIHYLLLPEDEGAILKSALEFGDTLVREVMTPRVEMIAIERSATLHALRELVAREKHSRIPVYRENLDRVEGVIHIKDLVPVLGQVGHEEKIERLLRPAHFVPETKRVSELLREMQKSRKQLAIVVDEYGSTAGLVTIEDLLEEIVGEIADEHEREDDILREGESTYLVTGLAELDRIEELFGAQLGNGEYDTVGGLIFSTLGRIPAPGERLEVKGIRIEVLDADRRRVYRVRLSPATRSQPPRQRA
jgi:CBS domain containing-hemolysin-like protein